MSNTLLQPASFLAMVYAGAVIGLAYEITRIIRRVFTGGFAAVFTDALFCAVFAAVCAIALLIANDGVMRLYLIGGLITGFFIERWSVGYFILRSFYALASLL